MSTVPPWLRELIDDAGLFPPARLSMPDAVRSHLATREGPWRELVGRFLCPVDRVEELLAALPSELAPIRLGLIGAVREVSDKRVRVELAEVAAVTSDLRAVQELAGELHHVGRPDVFIELPRTAGWSEDLEVKLASIKAFGHGAKLRTGGTVAEAFPSEAELATFLRAALAVGIRFKLTAGLHNAVRHTDELTGFEHHGFLNIAAAIVHAGDAERWLAERDPVALANAVGDVDAALVRTSWVAYGSCSIEEPVADLIDLGLLEKS